MNSTEQLQLDIIAKISAGKMSRREGQRILGVSERTLRRHLKEYVETGPMFVKHGNCKKSPINLTSPETKKRVLTLVREKYFDFNLTHCLEKLRADHKISISYDVLRRWCHEIGMVKRAKRRSSKVRRRRERMAQTGVMLQMDGSHHAWFGGKETCLIAAIDDADNDVPFGEFFPSEDTLSCMKVMQKIIEKKGLFQILYVDRAGIFGGPKRANFSQFKRAVEELGIHIIFANSAEGKGRIERLWNTFQDRLIPEMRIRNIQNYELANGFLQNQFLPSEYALKFKVIPENQIPGYQPLPPHIDLNEIFCLKEDRICARDHTFSWNGQTYQITSEIKQSIYKQKIQIRTYQDLSWKVFFAEKQLEVTLLKRPGKLGDLPQIEDLRGVKVRCDGHVHYLGRYYSVDEEYIGQEVSITERESQIIICRKGAVIEKHFKITRPEQQSSTKPEHLSPWKRALEVKSPYRTNARPYGKDVEAFVVTVIEQGQGFIDTATIYGVLGMDKTHAPQVINEACRLALELETPTYKAVRILLRLQPSRFEMKRAAKVG